MSLSLTHLLFHIVVFSSAGVNVTRGIIILVAAQLVGSGLTPQTCNNRGRDNNSEVRGEEIDNHVTYNYYN